MISITIRLLLLAVCVSAQPSSFDFTPPSPFPDKIPSASSFNGLAIAGIISSLVGLVIIAIIACTCGKRIAQAFQSSAVRITIDPSGSAPSPAPLNNNDVQIWGNDSPTVEKFLQDMAKEKPLRFTPQQLNTFTNNYSKKLGAGGFGAVYQGQFPNGVKIAVKVLMNRGGDRRESDQEQFMAEVSTIGRTYHINLVKLYGFCYDNIMSALVYEYMENGSLDKYLFQDTQVIEWEKLHDIALGTAKGISYLHEECEHRIIHYDIKPGNVLLDQKFFPKVADFGLAKLSNRDNTHVSMVEYRGTPGYSAPEFNLRNFPITHKCDVYSFGMLLFEILGRRKNAKAAESENASMDWFPKNVWEEYEKGELAALTLACGIEDKDREKAERMAKAALWCVQDSPELRPPMSAVVKMLEGGVEIMAPSKPFQYLFALGVNMPNSNTSFGSNSSWSNNNNNSQWYRETTAIMAKHEIQVAISSS